MEMLNQAFGNLNDTLLRNRMMKAEQARYQQEQQRLEEQNAALGQYRAEQGAERQRHDTEMEGVQKSLIDLRQREADISQERADTEKKAQSAKEKTKLYTPDGGSVTVPSANADAYKQSYASSHPGQELSEINPFKKTLNANGMELEFDNAADYNKAALAWQEHQATANKPNASAQPKMTTHQVLNPAHVVQGEVNTNQPPFLTLTNITEPYQSQTPTMPNGTNSVPTVNSQAEYDALQKGSKYRDSNGKLAVKK